jgi:Ca2+-binding RTX toxin-like protein
VNPVEPHRNSRNSGSNPRTGGLRPTCALTILRTKEFIMLDLQKLEQRRLLSATATVLPGGKLIVQGDKSNDDLLVTVVSRQIGQTIGSKPVSKLLTVPVITVFDHGTLIFTSTQGPRQAIQQIELYGSAGDDALVVNLTNASTSVLVDGQWDQDQITLNATGATGKAEVLGGDDADSITATTAASGSFLFDAGAGNDIVNLGVVGMSGHTVFGGEGDDRLILDAKLNETTARLTGFSAYGDAGNDFIQGSPLGDYLFAGEGDNEVHAGTGDDVVYGGSGSDVLYGDEGNDFLDHGGGFDMIDGGAGFDKAIAGTDDKVVDVEQFLFPL